MNKILMGLLALLLVGGGWWLGQERKGGTVAVAGEAKKMVVPTSFSLVVSKVNAGEELTSVLSQSEMVVAKLEETVKRLMGEGVELDKGFNQISPQTSGGYLVGNALGIKSNQIGKLRELVKELYISGASTVSSPTWEIDKKIEEIMRNEAFILAKAKAMEVGRSGGKRLGKIISISDEPVQFSGNPERLSGTKKLTVIFEIR